MDLLFEEDQSSYKATIKEIEAQDQLHAYNLECLAYLKRTKGLRDDMICGGDETNTYLFPGQNEIWEMKGGEAESCLKEDKRNYTNNIWNNAAGEVLFHHQIFFGKTEASLPSEAVRQKYPNFMFSTSKNHWCNQELKLKEASNTMLSFLQSAIAKYHLLSYIPSYKEYISGKYKDTKTWVLMKNKLLVVS